MMPAAALNEWLADFWNGVAVHLWQTTLVLIGIAILAVLLRRAPARMVNVLWWIALAKLLVPLAALEPLAASVGRWSAALRPGAGSATAARLVEYVRVALNPAPLNPSGAEPGAAWPALLTLVWVLGMAALLLLWTRPHRRRAEPVPRSLDDLRGALRDKLDAAIAGSGISTARIRIDSARAVPAVAGLIRPRILISQRVIEALDEQELRAVLLHEECHRRRFDPQLALSQRLALLLFFFYPPVWWITRRLRESAETACDESVLGIGVAPDLYVRALARALSLDLTPSRLPAAVGLGRRRGLGRRLERIEDSWRYRMMPRYRWILVVALVFVFAPLLPAALSVGTETAPASGVVVDGVRSRFVDLDRLEGADLVVRLNFRSVPLEKVFDSLQKSTGVRIDVEGTLPLCDEIDLGPVTLREVLVYLALKHDLVYQVESWDTLRVRLPLLAGQDGVTNPKLRPEFRVNPVYPEEERAAGIEGHVVLQAVIQRDGSVSSVETLRGVQDHPAFTENAIEAVRRWRYEPATLDGRPVEVYFTIFIEYSLE